MTTEYEEICRRYADRWRGNVDGRTRPTVHQTANWLTTTYVLLAHAFINTAITFHNEAETICSISGHLLTPLVICLRYVVVISFAFINWNNVDLPNNLRFTVELAHNGNTVIQCTKVYRVCFKTSIALRYVHRMVKVTRKPSCRWQTRATLAKSSHGLRKSSGVVSCIARLPIDS